MSSFLAESRLSGTVQNLVRFAAGELEFKGFSYHRQPSLPIVLLQARACIGTREQRTSSRRRSSRARSGAPLLGVLATLQGLTGRPYSGFRRRSLHALAVPHRPLLEPQGIYQSHCGDSDCAEPPLPPGLSTLVSWPRLRWAACLAHGFTANTERVAASPLFALAGSRHLDQREAGLPRSGLSGRW